MAKHAKLCPPSGWDRWSTCSGSVDHQTGGGSDYAAEGTAAHWLAYNAFTSARPPVDYIGMVVWVPTDEEYAEGKTECFYDEVGDAPLTGWTFEVDEDMAYHVDTYMQEVYMQDADMLIFEGEVPIGHITGEDGATGHCDVGRVFETTLASHDLKYGQGHKVYAKNNGQQLLFLLGLLELHGWVEDFDTFEVHIHQPRLNHHDVWTLTLPELMVWAEKIRAKGHAITIDGVREYVPSAAACKFCDIRGTCDHRTNHVLDVVKSFPPVAPDTFETPEEAAEYYNKTLIHREHVESWAKDVFNTAKAFEKDNPDLMADYGMKPGRKSRKIVDEKKVKATLKELGHKLDEYAPRVMLTAPQLEKTFGKTVYKEYLEAYIDDVPGAPIFGKIPKDAKRQRQVDLDMFSDLDEQSETNDHGKSKP